MIKIFDATDKKFNTAGNIIINPLKCLETKKKSLNGWYIDVEIPIKYKDYIEQDKLCVVKTKSKLNPQAFRIKNIEETTRKIIFQAEHVMFDAKDYLLLDVRPTNKNAQNALSYINEKTDNISPFSTFSNVESINTAYFIRKNLLEAWETIEERWQGVFDADNWNISFLVKVGNDNGETITYGKNMQGIQIYEDWSSVCTKVCPTGYNELMLPEIYLEANIQYEQPYTRTVQFETQLEEEQKTEENMIIELRKNAKQYLEINKIPHVSYVVNANINEKLEIGDTVHVKHSLCNILTEVLEYKYNVISEKMKSISFGNYTRDVKTKFDNIKKDINKIVDSLSQQGIAIKNQTDLINSLNKNGHLYIDDNEILILDQLPKSEAKNIWRIGLAGFGFSSNGYEGHFEVAITMDGQINANFITTGVMSVSRIEGLTNVLEDMRSIIELNGSNITAIVKDIYSEDGIIHENFTKIYHDINNIINSVQNSGGNNLIRNSVMFAFNNSNVPDNWELEGTGTLNIQSSVEALNAGSSSGHVFTLNNKVVRQRVLVKADSDDILQDKKTYYTFSTKIKKEVTGSCYIKIFNENEEYIVQLNEENSSFYGDYEIKALLPSMNYYDIEFSSTDCEATFTDNMFAVGEYKSQWTQANGEIMNTQVNISINGVLVKSSVYQGDYTIMSPLEFAGYSKVNGTITKVFSLNKDVTLVKKLEAEDEIKMKPIKVVPINTRRLTRLGFCPIDLKEGD